MFEKRAKDVIQIQFLMKVYHSVTICIVDSVNVSLHLLRFIRSKTWNSLSDHLLEMILLQLSLGMMIEPGSAQVAYLLYS